MQNQSPFSAQVNTLPITVTATASTSVALPGQGSTIRVVNLGPNVAYISIGSGTQTATLPNSTPTNTSTPVLAGTDVSLSIPNDQIYNISAICASTQSAVLNVQVGGGF